MNVLPVVVLRLYFACVSSTGWIPINTGLAISVAVFAY